MRLLRGRHINQRRSEIDIRTLVRPFFLHILCHRSFPSLSSLPPPFLSFAYNYLFAPFTQFIQEESSNNEMAQDEDVDNWIDEVSPPERVIQPGLGGVHWVPHDNCTGARRRRAVTGRDTRAGNRVALHGVRSRRIRRQGWAPGRHLPCPSPFPSLSLSTLPSLLLPRPGTELLRPVCISMSY